MYPMIMLTYLFIFFGCAGSLLLREGFSCCRALALELSSLIVVCWLGCSEAFDLNSPTRDWTHVLCSGRWILNHWTVREVPSCSLLSTCYTFQLSQSYFTASSSFWMNYSVFVPKESHSICLILSHLTSHTHLKSALQNVSHPVWWHLPI